MQIILSLCEARQSMGKLSLHELSTRVDSRTSRCKISNTQAQIDLFEPKKPFSTFVPHLAVSFDEPPAVQTST